MGEDREANTRSKLRLEREPLGNGVAERELPGDPGPAADVEDLADWVTREQGIRLDVAGQEPGQPAPAATEVEHGAR